MSLKNKAKETLEILDQGGFDSPEGKWIDLSLQLKDAVAGSKTYVPEQFTQLTEPINQGDSTPVFEVTTETTQIAAGRLSDEGYENIVLLNFASARNPGGGFLNGAKAQEEDLARCSGLFYCLRSQMDYYDANRKQTSMLYTDHVIYSPKVPWFRVRSRDQPDRLFTASVITAPAPNATQARRRDYSEKDIEGALYRRCGQVLGVARDNHHRVLLLGAWGCGVFGNKPTMVAKSFYQWLTGDVFLGAFDRVVFAIYDRTKDKKVYGAFAEQFQSQKQ